MGVSLKFLGVLAVACLILTLAPHTALAGPFVAFGPQTFTRGTGAPVTETRSFSVRNPATRYTLRVRNVRTASAVVMLNGRGVLGPSAFNANVSLMEIPVTLQRDNVLTVQLRSAPGSSIVLEVEGVDDDLPSITATTTAVPNVYGWNNADVIVAFVCDDATSGVVSCPSPVTVAEETNGRTVTGEVVDKAGNRASTSVTIRLDKTPPILEASQSPLANANGWNNGPVVVSFEATDALSGVVPGSLSAPVTLAAEGTNLSASGRATDLAGNVGSITQTGINIDQTRPTITVATSPAPNASGWNNGSVTAHFTCADALSGTPSCPADQVINSEGPNQTVSGTVTDAAGNSASVTSGPFGLDLGPPFVTVALDPAPNANGWNKGPVTAHFTCSDSVSGVVSCPPDQVVAIEGADQAVAGSAVDVAGNSSVAMASVSLDRSPPVFTFTSPPNGSILPIPTVTARGTATDALSGVAGVTCNGLPAAVTGTSVECAVTLTPGPISINGAATDVAGNTTTTTLDLVYRNAPTITITSPPNLSYLNITPTTVTGTVDDPAATVAVNSIESAVVNGSFSLALPLAEGPNIITAVATAPNGTAGTVSLTVTLDTTPPHVTVTSPPDQFVTTDASISVAGIINDIVVGTVNDQQAQVMVNGAAAQVANRTFLATTVPLAIGPNTIQAVARDRVGNAATTQITVVRQVLTEPQIQRVSGNGQTGAIGSPLSEPLVVALSDGLGSPVANKTVIFKVTQNDGLLAADGAPTVTVLATTDAQGQARARWTLGNRAGAGGNVVEAYSVGFEGTAIFTATGTQGTAGKIVVDTGNDQIGPIGQALPKPFIAVVVDGGNNRLAGVPVTFTVQQGGGNFDGQPTYTAISDSDGRVAATLTLGLQEGSANNLVEANFPFNTGFAAAFTASGRAPGNPTDTTISGVVLDNSNVPIPGVTVRAVLTNVVRSNLSAVQAATAVQTDDQGQFTIPQAPVGLIKLMIDGTTAQREGTYPSLEYDLVTVAGQKNDVGQPIYLLPLSTANQLCVTATTGGGTLTIPEAPGFSLTFGPGQVTFPGGSKSGCVSVTVVNGDKVPMVPGFGQQPRFIVTIQPAGAVFNPPAPITLPNVDGLKPRAVTEMYSYDHDIGSFVAIGTGIVSDDGQVIRSSPGVGVLKAGWHCGGNPTENGTVVHNPNWEILLNVILSAATARLSSPLGEIISVGTALPQIILVGIWGYFNKLYLEAVVRLVRDPAAESEVNYFGHWMSIFGNLQTDPTYFRKVYPDKDKSFEDAVKESAATFGYKPR